MLELMVPNIRCHKCVCHLSRSMRSTSAIWTLDVLRSFHPTSGPMRFISMRFLVVVGVLLARTPVLHAGSPDVFNVKDYGAKGDGVTDDRAAFQATLAAIPTGGGVCYVPAWTYVIGAPHITISASNIHLQGAGQG